MNVFVLDACALIAYLRNEKGVEKIITIFDDANNLDSKVIVHGASITEVYYDFWKMAGKITADSSF
jgi:PIN domain nuclease of toxin-antitoxin system